MPPPTWFDESRLDDESTLTFADPSLRQLAESGARVRREAGEAASALSEAVALSTQYSLIQSLSQRSMSARSLNPPILSRTMHLR